MMVVVVVRVTWERGSLQTGILVVAAAVVVPRQC